jgi:hypothetical protein
LSLDSLGGVHQEQSPFTGINGPAYLIAKIHMSRGINQIKEVDFSVRPGIGNGYSLTFDGNPPLPLYVHIIQYLILKIPIFYQTAFLDKPVRQSRFSVINMSNNTKVTDQGSV